MVSTYLVNLSMLSYWLSYFFFSLSRDPFYYWPVVARRRWVNAPDLSAVNIWAEIIFIWSLEYPSPKLKSRFNSQNIHFQIFHFLSQRRFELEIDPREKMFKIKTVPKCSKKILQSYQAGEDLGIDVTGRFEIKTKDKIFTTSIYPLLQSDHLYDQLKG